MSSGRSQFLLVSIIVCSHSHVVNFSKTAFICGSVDQTRHRLGVTLQSFHGAEWAAHVILTSQSHSEANIRSSCRGWNSHLLTYSFAHYTLLLHLLVFFSYLLLFISLFCRSVPHMSAFVVLLSLSFLDLLTSSCSHSDHTECDLSFSRCLSFICCALMTTHYIPVTTRHLV